MTYVLPIGNCPDMINKTKLFLASKIEMKDIGAATCALEIRISRERF
jgi:hypothetical protein